MAWRPSGYMFTTKQLIRAMFDDSTDEAKLLIAATAGEVELFAENRILECCSLAYHERSQRGWKTHLYWE